MGLSFPLSHVWTFYHENIGGITWCPVVRTQHFHCKVLGSIPGQGTKILQAEKHKQKIA